MPGSIRNLQGRRIHEKLGFNEATSLGENRINEENTYLKY